MSDEELENLIEQVKKASDNYACLIDGEMVLLDKRAILSLAHEVQDLRGYCELHRKEVKKLIEGLQKSLLIRTKEVS